MQLLIGSSKSLALYNNTNFYYLILSVATVWDRSDARPEAASSSSRLMQQLEQLPSHQIQQQQQQQQQPFRLINSNHHVQTLENGSLAIRSIGREHAGAYICEAANGVAPNLVKQIRLIVRSPAYLPDDIQVAIGSPLQNATLLVEPFNGAQPMHSTASRIIPTQMASGASSSASNSMHQPTATKSVRLALNTTNVRLSCWPLGDLPMQIEWLKDDRLLHSHSTSLEPARSSNPTASSSSLDSSSSSLVAATGSDLYLPMLVASNSGANTALGRYRVATRWHQKGSTALQKHSSQAEQLGLTEMHSRAGSNGPVALESELMFVGPLNRLDAAQYTCVVRNAYGSSERKLRLIVMEPPEAPQLVDVAHISSRSIGLRWPIPFDGNSPILKYIVEYRRVQGEFNWLLLWPTHPTGCQRANRFLHHPANEFASDDSERTQTLSHRSEKLVPLKAAASTSSSSSSPQLVELIGGGQVPYLSSALAESNSSAQVHHTLHDLEPLTRYSIRVISANALGQSRPSVALSLRTTEEGKLIAVAVHCCHCHLRVHQPASEEG